MKVILIVDDEATFATKILWALKACGVNVQYVHVCINDKEARSKFMEVAPDIVFLDINIPGSKDGFQILEEFMDLDNATLGMLSKSSDETDIEYSRKIGASFFIVKDGRPMVFKNRMNEFKEKFIDNGKQEQFVFFG